MRFLTKVNLSGLATWALLAVGCQQILGIGDRHLGQQDAAVQPDSAAQRDAREAGSIEDALVGDGSPADAPPTSDGGDAASTCPAEMVYVAAAGVCIDRYEASPVGVGEAASVALVMPWTVVSCDEAAAACQLVGKRLCEDSEWTAACQGVTVSTYPYGDTYNPTVCNGSGHTAGVPVPTGSMSQCEGGYAGLHDLSGNVAEWTAKSSGLCHARGGSFYDDATTLRCDAVFSAASSNYALNIGFRCCRAP
jgi:hypothetical protein